MLQGCFFIFKDFIPFETKVEDGVNFIILVLVILRNYNDIFISDYVLYDAK